MNSTPHQPRHNSITVAQICTAINEGRLRPTISDGYYIFSKREAICILHRVEQPLQLLTANQPQATHK